MKPFSLIAGIFGLSLAACASTSAPKPAQPVETTSAPLPREAFTPPDQWEMTISDDDKAEPKKDDAPVQSVQADKAAAKRQSGLITLPKKPETPPIAPAAVK